ADGDRALVPAGSDPAACHPGPAFRPHGGGENAGSARRLGSGPQLRLPGRDRPAARRHAAAAAAGCVPAACRGCCGELIMALLIDSHCHLDFPDFADERDAIIARARQAGVGLMLTISTRLDQFDRVLAVAEAYPDVYCTVGIHPHEASDHVDVDAAKLVALTRHPKVVGIGETGLDYYYEHSDRESQKHCFLAHIAAARETGLPVVIHTRDADEDMAAIIEAEMGKGRFKGLLHCFSSGHALAELAVRHGMMVSFSGILTFNKARDVQESARALPMENLLVETDAPY